MLTAIVHPWLFIFDTFSVDHQIVKSFASSLSSKPFAVSLTTPLERFSTASRAGRPIASSPYLSVVLAQSPELQKYQV
jgi:hypothetical protein